MLKLIYERYLAAGGELDFWSFQKPLGGLVLVTIIDGEPNILFWDDTLDALGVERPSTKELIAAMNAGPDLDEARADAIAMLGKSCATAIVSGYSSDALGSSHTYPSDFIAQINMMGSVTDALIPGRDEKWVTPFWCADATGFWSFRPHTAPQILAAGQAGKAHVVLCQSKLIDLTGQVKSADSIEEIASISW